MLRRCGRVEESRKWVLRRVLGLEKVEVLESRNDEVWGSSLLLWMLLDGDAVKVVGVDVEGVGQGYAEGEKKEVREKKGPELVC